MLSLHGSHVTWMSACVMNEQTYSDYYKLQMVTVMAHEGFEGQLRAQINEEFKGYKAVVKVLLWDQMCGATRVVK